MNPKHVILSYASLVWCLGKVKSEPEKCLSVKLKFGLFRVSGNVPSALCFPTVL